MCKGVLAVIHFWSLLSPKMGDSFLCWATLFAPLAVSFVARRRTHSSNRGEDDGKHFQGEDLHESHAPFFLEMMIVCKLIQKEHTKLLVGDCTWHFVLEFLGFAWWFTLGGRSPIAFSRARCRGERIIGVSPGSCRRWPHLHTEPGRNARCFTRKWCSNVRWVFETLQ